jgi:hypothetical protein
MEYSVGLSTIGRRDLANLDPSVAPRVSKALYAHLPTIRVLMDV